VCVCAVCNCVYIRASSKSFFFHEVGRKAKKRERCTELWKRDGWVRLVVDWALNQRFYYIVDKSEQQINWHPTRFVQAYGCQLAINRIERKKNRGKKTKKRKKQRTYILVFHSMSLFSFLLCVRVWVSALLLFSYTFICFCVCKRPSAHLGVIP
jgi:hypothetical protein